MTAQQQRQQRHPPSRHTLFLAVACSLFGVTQAGSAAASSLAFAAIDQATVQRERHSHVRLFSRCHDTHLHAATLSYAPESATATTTARRDPFDPDFRPSFDNDGGFWGPVAVSRTGTYAAPPPALVTIDDQSYHIYCDLDGVLVDFEAGVQKICQRSTDELEKTTMWKLIEQSSTNFFADLPWMPGGQQLWNSIKTLNPTILTGVPDLKGSCQDKFHWCRTNLGMNGEYRHVDMAAKFYRHASRNGVAKACRQTESHVTNVITCWSYNKHHESGRYKVLIDDRLVLKDAWEAKGGIFVHHTDTDGTLSKLRELGVLQSGYHQQQQHQHQPSRRRNKHAFMP
jgi:hypothetical protein